MFNNLAEIEKYHLDLLESLPLITDNISEEMRGKIRQFIEECRESSPNISYVGDRQILRSFLEFWVTILIRNGEKDLKIDIDLDPRFRPKELKLGYSCQPN